MYPCETELASFPFVVFKKLKGKWHLMVDYRKLKCHEGIQKVQDSPH